LFGHRLFSMNEKGSNPAICKMKILHIALRARARHEQHSTNSTARRGSNPRMRTPSQFFSDAIRNIIVAHLHPHHSDAKDHYVALGQKGLTYPQFCVIIISSKYKLDRENIKWIIVMNCLQRTP